MSSAIIEGACSLLIQESIKAAANKAAEVIVNQGCGAIGAAAIANPIAAGGVVVGAAGVGVAVYTVANQNQKIEAVRTEYKEEIKGIRDKHEKDLEKITEKHEQDLKDLKIELKAENKKNMKKKNAYIKKLEAKYEARMNDIQARAEEDKIEMKKDLEEKIAQKDIECEFLLNKIVEINNQFANTTNLLIEKINSLEKDMQNQKEINKRSEERAEKFEKRNIELETNLQNEKKARQADLEKFQEAKSKDLERRIKFNESQIIETFKMGKENNEAKQIKIQNENKELNPSKNQKQIKENNQKLQNLKEEIIDRPSKRMIFASATEIQKDQIEANEIRDQKEKVNFISDNLEVQEIFCALKIQNNLQERIPVL